jgi:hypothetical protein
MSATSASPPEPNGQPPETSQLGAEPVASTSPSLAARAGRPRSRFAMKLRRQARDLLGRLPVLRALDESARDDACGGVQPPFAGSGVYWEERYVSGGNSGRGSYNKFAEFKAEILNNFVISNGIESVIEFGCGDGNQLMLARYPTYLGFDVSPTAVEVCQHKFAADRSKCFKLLDRYSGERSDLTISLDVIFHLINDEEFEEHMQVVFNSADRFVIIYSSNTDKNKHNYSHIKHRKFTRWIKANTANWSLARRVPNRYPYKGDHKKGSFADFYIYRKSPLSRRYAGFFPRIHDKI